MNKLIFILVAIFLVSVIGATVYQTPGTSVYLEHNYSACSECNYSVCDCPVCNTKDISNTIFVCIFGGAVFIGGLYFIIRRKIMKRRRANKDKEIYKPNYKPNEKIYKSEKEFDELVDELGLNDVKDKIKEIE